MPFFLFHRATLVKGGVAGVKVFGVQLVGRDAERLAETVNME